MVALQYPCGVRVSGRGAGGRRAPVGRAARSASAWTVAGATQCSVVSDQRKRGAQRDTNSAIPSRLSATTKRRNYHVSFD